MQKKDNRSCWNLKQSDADKFAFGESSTEMTRDSLLYF